MKEVSIQVEIIGLRDESFQRGVLDKIRGKIRKRVFQRAVAWKIRGKIRKRASSKCSTKVETVEYSSPEVLDASSENEYNGEKADIYSFGMTLYSIIYNKIPFNEIKQRTKIILEILRGKRPVLNDENELKSLNELIKRCWDAEPDKRPNFEEITKILLKEKSILEASKKIEAKKVNNLIEFCNSNQILNSEKSEFVKQLNNSDKNPKKSETPKKSEIPKKSEKSEKQEYKSPTISKISNQKMKVSKKDVEEFNLKYENDTDHQKDSKFKKLHFAAKINSKEIGEILISKGADVNAKDAFYKIIH